MIIETGKFNLAIPSQSHLHLPIQKFSVPVRFFIIFSVLIKIFVYNLFTAFITLIIEVKFTV